MDELYNLCKQNKKIVIYGAGRIANILYLYLEQQKLNERVDFFVVTKMDNNTIYKYGKIVLEFDNAKDRLNDSIILVAMLNVIQNEVVETLVKAGYRNYYCVDERYIVDVFYDELHKTSIQGDKIIFQNMNGNGYGCNPKYIAAELINYMHCNNKYFDLVWVVNDDRYKFPSEIRTVKYGSLKYYEELATARLWIDNARKGLDVKKRDGQKYIQVWHGAAPIKKVEADVEAALPQYYVDSAKYDSQMADLFLSGSEFYTNLYRKSFWYDGDILKVGLPRQDAFWNIENITKKVKVYYGIQEQAIALYAPTFRHDFDSTVYDIQLDEIKNALEQRFEKEFVLMVSKHPNNNNINYPFEGKCNYLDVSNYDDFEEILVSADVLITDYSGCMYDYSISQRPVFLYQNDYADYLADRDFYVSMSQLPYIKAYSNEELVNKIIEFDECAYKNRLADFMNSMHNYDDGTASQKVVDFIIEHYLRY